MWPIKLLFYITLLSQNYECLTTIHNVYDDPQIKEVCPAIIQMIEENLKW